VYISEKALLARAAISKRRSKRDLKDVPEWLDEWKGKNSVFVKGGSGF
jgi:hypothetical protein